MSTHNICFRTEIRKIICGYLLLSGAMHTVIHFTYQFCCLHSVDNVATQFLSTQFCQCLQISCCLFYAVCDQY